MAVLNLLALIIATLLLLFRRTSGAGISADTLNSEGNVTDGETLVSAGGTFTLPVDHGPDQEIPRDLVHGV